MSKPRRTLEASSRVDLKKSSKTAHKLEVGLRLRLIIQSMGMSYTDFAKAFNVTKHAIRNWMEGENYPAIPIMIKLCEEQQLTLDYIFRDQMGGVSVSAAERLKQSKAAFLVEPAAASGPELERI